MEISLHTGEGDSLSDFSKSMRESIPYPDRTPCIRLLSNEEKYKQEKRFLLNQDMSQFYRNKRLEKLERFNRKYELNKSVTQIAKNMIFEGKLNDRVDRLQIKLNKFEIRQRKGMCGDIKGSWLMMVTVFGYAERFKDMLDEKKKIRAKCWGYYKKFRVFAWSIGKLIRIIAKTRQAENTRILMKQVAERLKKNVITRVLTRNLLARQLEMIITKGLFLTLIPKFNTTIIFIQRALKKCLDYRKFLYYHILAYWKNKEKQISLIIASKKGKKQPTLSDDTKLEYIKNWVRQQIKQYVNLFKEYTFLKLTHPNPAKPQQLLLFSQKSLDLIAQQISNTVPRRLSMRLTIPKD